MATLKDKKKGNAKVEKGATATLPSDLNSLTIKQLKETLDSKKISYKAKEKKAYYVELLQEQLETKKAVTKKKPEKKKKASPSTKKTAKKTTKKVESTVKADKKDSAPTFIKSNKLAPMDLFYSSDFGERSKITIIMRDAKWLFAYWELGGALFEQCKTEIEQSNSTIENITLRVINENGNYYDIDIKYGASSFYFEPQIDGCLKVELGLKNSDGRFYSIAISNSITINNFKEAKSANNVLWMNNDKSISVNDNVEPINSEIIVESLGGVKYIKKIIGSEEFLSVLKENLSSAVTSNFISKIVSSFVSSGISSEISSETSSYNSKNTIRHAINADENEDDAFWLIANTELILYGATEPDAKLTVAGKNISLNEDGTFFLRMPLPDGDVDLPVEAHSSNGKHYRKIHPQVKKWTK